ncbi:WD repeat-containing protein WRAP73 [Marchantia polymorpha subsp. ruderalis]|uniref:Anaphase-promoting complex subunit 4 WD40 domain-containing protein n=2 Tax=Marchantia polymorpha TaxID=3197 RepID=A0AAF6B4B8_MARPO|nr:hypothetical protein MARPO_0178s0015 [Marchantia polymorpha]BBN06852.1 hypothetical protein Mp_3g24390 [Marchantia polymorpha subsp. ruderalis]|eukprot:PTQ27964.1 hypothetical protein MARPO_0178s0015 [Marchantia polymorpha]
MEFSDTYKHSGPCYFSPDSRFIAVAVDYRLVIRDVTSLKVVQLYSCLDKISHVEWAPDSEYVLCALYKKSIVQAWSVTQPEWTCKIDEGAAGMTHARWSPDSRHILTTSEFLLRVTVWSLVSKACVHLQWPKHASRAVSFTQDGKFVAIGTRKDCKDYINLLSCNGWEAMGVFETETTDFWDLEWSPKDSTIAVWDSPLEYKVLIYSPDGRCLFKYSAYENALGIKTVAWSPCGQFLGVGSYDQAVRALNHLTWKPVAEFTHPIVVKGPYNAVVFKEIEESLHMDISKLNINGKSSHDRMGFKGDHGGYREDDRHEGPTRIRYDVLEFPVTMISVKPPLDKPNPKQGIGILSWSPDSRFLLTRNDNMANALWIWDVARLELSAVLLHKDPIRTAVWDPVHTRIALCTGTSSLFLWTPAGACCVNIPLPQFVASDLKWNPDGSSLLLKDKEAFCVTFVPSISDFEEANGQ